MLRRVSRTLRALLTALGLASLVWIVPSLFCHVTVCYYGVSDTVIRVQDGAILLYLLLSPPSTPDNLIMGKPGSLSTPKGWHFSWQFTDVVDGSPLSRLSDTALPGLHKGDWAGWRLVEGTLPLWLLAATCLAWPVTSFIVHRRRRRRGFAVEAKAGEPAAAP